MTSRKSGDVPVLWILFFVILFLSLGFLTGCGAPDIDENLPIKEKITQCIDAGGVPKYTDDRDGNLVEWLGCAYG